MADWVEGLLCAPMTTDEHCEFVENLALKMLKAARRKHRNGGLSAADCKALKPFIGRAEDIMEEMADTLALSAVKATDLERRKAQSKFLRLQANRTRTAR